jgi:hypothetical protein
MQQAIETKFYGPTNSSGSRIVAKAWAGSVKVHYNHALNADQNHLQAAKALADKMGWGGLWIGGGRAAGNGYVFVNAMSNPASIANADTLAIGREGCDWFIVEGQCSASPCEAVERDRAL